MTGTSQVSRRQAVDAAKREIAEKIAQVLRAEVCGDDLRVVQVDLWLHYTDRGEDFSEPVTLEITTRELTGC